MKSFWLLLALIVPLFARAQDRLQFQAVVTMHDSGSWSGWSKWDPTGTYGGPESRTFAVRFDDTLSIVGDSITQSVIDRADTATCVFDRNTSTIRHLRIAGSGGWGTDGESYLFTISIDSLPIQQPAGSVLTIEPGSYTCQTTSSYSYSHPGGPESSGLSLTQCSGSGSGSGPTAFDVPTASSGVRVQNSNSTIRILSLAGGAVQIEAELNGPNEPIEIFDDLGRIVYHANFDGGPVRLTNLRAGCYFARLGGTCMKFVLSE